MNNRIEKPLNVTQEEIMDLDDGASLNSDNITDKNGPYISVKATRKKDGSHSVIVNKHHRLAPPPSHLPKRRSVKHTLSKKKKS